VPGVGFSAGLERILLALEERGRTPGTEAPLVFVARAGGADVEAAAQILLREIRGMCAAVAELEPGRSLGGQFKHADRLGAVLAVILGEDELAAGQVTVKDLRSGTQEKVARAEIAAHLARTLASTPSVENER
jgi:histidyl-tRNA synthetase